MEHQDAWEQAGKCEDPEWVTEWGHVEDLGPAGIVACCRLWDTGCKLGLGLCPQSCGALGSPSVCELSAAQGVRRWGLCPGHALKRLGEPWGYTD